MSRTLAIPPVGVLLVLGSCISLQFGAALATKLFPTAGTFGTTFLRLGFAGLIMIAVTRPPLHRWTGQQWKSLFFFGLALGCMNSFFYSAIARIPLGPAVTIEFIGPLVLSAVLSRCAKDLIWVATAMVGMTLLGIESLMGVSALDPLGILYALIAGILWAFYIMATAKAGKMIEGTGGLAVGIVIAALVAAPFGAQPSFTALSHGGITILFLAVGVALLGSVLPYLCEFLALRRMPSATFGILLSLEPVIAALAGWLLMSQKLGPLSIGAIVLVMIASIGTTFTAQQQSS